MLPDLPRIDLFSLANNHISDAWEVGVEGTIEALDQHKKRHFGYGRDLLEARRPALIEHNGIRLGFLGYCCLTTNGENYATPSKAGVCPLAFSYIETDISRLKNEVDHVIVALHWGEEDNHYPTPDQIALAHRSIDKGASVVIGTHPHVIQGIEPYKAGFICYSLGNFIFSDTELESMHDGKLVRTVLRLSNCNKESLGAEFVFEKGVTKLSAIQAYKLDKYLLPNAIPLDHLETNVNKLNAKLKAYSENKSRYLKKLNELQIAVRFEGNKYQNRYVLKPINEYESASRLQAFFHTLLHNLMSYGRRSFWRLNRRA